MPPPAGWRWAHFMLLVILLAAPTGAALRAGSPTIGSNRIVRSSCSRSMISSRGRSGTLLCAADVHSSSSEERTSTTDEPLPSAESASLYASLQKRAAAIDEGAGRRYRVESLVGFLNVHEGPGDPWRTDNVVRQLPHGAVVESIAEQDVWVKHDGGGWSIRVYDGHEFLVPLD